MLESKVFYMRLPLEKYHWTNRDSSNPFHRLSHRNLQAVETCDILTWTDVLSIIQNFI